MDKFDDGGQVLGVVDEARVEHASVGSLVPFAQVAQVALRAVVQEICG